MSMCSEIQAYFITNSIGTSSNIFVSPSQIPDAPDDIICLFEYGWSPTDLTFDRKGDIRPQLRVFVRYGKQDYADGITKCEDIHDLLHGIANTTIGSTNYKLIRALGVPEYQGLDGKGRHLWNVSFGVVKDP